MRGAVSQIFGIAGILIGFLAASHKYIEAGALIHGRFPSVSTAAAQPLGFILLFLLTWFIIALVGLWVVRFLHMAGLGFLDRLWGAMIGFGKAFLFAVVAISVLTLFSGKGGSTVIAQSRLAPVVMDVSQFLFKLAPPKVQEELARKQEEMKKALTKRTEKLMDSFLGHGADSKEKGGKKKE